MDLTGKITGLTVDFETQKAVVTFATDQRPAEIEQGFTKLKGKQLDITAKIHREKRSLNANAYFHLLIGKIAGELNVTTTYIKNQLIADYGQVLFINDEIATIKTQLTPDIMQEQSHLHTKYVGYKCEDIAEYGEIRSKAFYIYHVYRGSSTYNTKEMSLLIDGTVTTAKELGIETLTPAQIEEIKQKWRVDINAPAI